MRRAEGMTLIEGPRLLEAYLSAGGRPRTILATEEALGDPETARLVAGHDPVLVSAPVFRAIAEAQTPQGIAAEIEIPAPRLARGDFVFLEGIQDAGNVGAILRSAAAFGVAAVVLDRACADPWSPKALRAGAGGHFSLSVQQVADLADALDAFPGTLACTVARGGQPPERVPPEPAVGWIFGSEGAGVSAALQARAALKVTIPAAARIESLNVAAAAAICLHGRFNRPGAGS